MPMIATGAVPELPEVESARATIERAALHRPIADVDDHDTWECRPHASGEIRAALVARALTAACRQGKSLWCETSDSGPVLGLHLGMSGRILVTDGAGGLAEGGDRIEGSGGVHTGVVIPHRRPGGHCPRFGAALERATVGGRTTWFCPREQL